MIDSQKKKLSWKDCLLPIILIALGVGFSVYVVEFPQDSIVDRYVSYGKILKKIYQHVYIVAISASLAIITSVSLGIIFTRASLKNYARYIVNVVNICQTIPSLAVVALFAGILGIVAKTAIFALWIYSLLPILNNTLTGILEVDDSIIEAARGMGMKPSRILKKIEIPLALPVMMAGIRTAITINIGTTVLAAFIGAGGLGDLIIAGNNVDRWQIVVLGASIPALMAILVDYLLGLFESNLVHS